MQRKLRHQRSGASLLKISLIALTLSGCATLTGCKKEGPNIDELCQLNGDGSAECSDGVEGYTKDPEDLVNYIALSPENYRKILAWGRERYQVQHIKLSDNIHWDFLEELGSPL